MSDSEDDRRSDVSSSDAEEDPGSDWEDDQTDSMRCLFCTEEHPEKKALFEHMSTKHAFNLPSVQTELGLDFYGTVKLVNFIRANASKSTPTALLGDIRANPSVFSDNAFLKPVLADDALLFNLEDDDDEDEDDKPRAGPAAALPAEDSKAATSDPALKRENQLLRDEVSELRERLAAMTSTLRRFASDDDTSDGSGESKVPARNPHDAGYFEGYSYRDIHEVMLKDKARTLAYRDFIYENKHLFEGKVVLDVGCGTGILCMFAARAGAKKVVGVDRADIIDKAREIVKSNGLDHIITLVKSKVEEAVLPLETSEVDVIVSEWMGYFLLYESMLPSVLFARDKYLAPTGGVYPNKATMYIAAFEASGYKRHKVDFWKNVYGFNMSCLIDAREQHVSYRVAKLKEQALISQPATLQAFDMMTVKTGELDFEAKFRIPVTRQDSFDGLVVYFDVEFDLNCTKKVTLPTGPQFPLTHWKQSLFYLSSPTPVKPGDVIVGEMKAKRDHKVNRDYRVRIRYAVERDGVAPSEESFIEQEYLVS